MLDWRTRWLVRREEKALYGYCVLEALDNSSDMRGFSLAYGCRWERHCDMPRLYLYILAMGSIHRDDVGLILFTNIGKLSCSTSIHVALSDFRHLAGNWFAPGRLYGSTPLRFGSVSGPGPGLMLITCILPCVVGSIRSVGTPLQPTAQQPSAPSRTFVCVVENRVNKCI
jgi:hypothetical protein